MNTNPRVLELWRELNVLAETDEDAAWIVNGYRAGTTWPVAHPATRDEIEQFWNESYDARGVKGGCLEHYDANRPKHQRRQYATVSVRSWFRKMRAAEFEKLTCWLFRSDVVIIQAIPVSIKGAVKPWTLLDTQKLVDRETARTYDVFSRSHISCFRSDVPTSSRAIALEDLLRWMGDVRIGPDVGPPWFTNKGWSNRG